MRLRGVVKSHVPKPVLRDVGSTLEPVGAITELQVVPTHVLKTSPFQEAGGRGITLSHLEGTGGAVEASRGAGRGAQINCHIRPLAEGGLIAPGAGLIGREAYPPDVAACAALAVSVEEAGHYVVLAGGTGEGDLEPVVEEGVWGVIGL